MLKVPRIAHAYCAGSESIRLPSIAVRATWFHGLIFFSGCKVSFSVKFADRNGTFKCINKETCVKKVLE